MPENAAERALRLLDMVPFIVGNQGITISELASHFSVSRDEIVKDLNLLFLCGLPGYTPLELIDLSLEDDVVVIRDPQNLVLPRNFSYAESVVLRIALAALREVIGTTDPRQKTLSSLIQKLEETYSSNIPSEAFYIEIEKDKITLQTVEQALKEENDLEIKYLNRAKDEVTERRVSPKTLHVKESKVQMEGYCHLSKESRTFNLDQILEIKLIPASDFIETGLDKEKTSYDVELSITDESSSFLQGNLDHLIRTGDNSFVMKLHNPQWLIRHALSSEDMEITQPPTLRKAVLEEARTALQRYRAGV